MTDAEAIKAWLDRWDEHMDDKCSCEKCRRKRAILMAVEFIEDADPGDGLMHDCVLKVLSTIRETLVS